MRETNIYYKTEAYVQPPTRCFKCQGFGHTAPKCRNRERCARCAGEHDTRKCGSSYSRCVNCGEPHSARYRGCYAYFKAVCITAIARRDGLPWYRAEKILLREERAMEEEERRRSSSSPSNSPSNSPSPQSGPGTGAGPMSGEVDPIMVGRCPCARVSSAGGASPGDVGPATPPCSPISTHENEGWSEVGRGGRPLSGGSPLVGGAGSGVASPPGSMTPGAAAPGSSSVTEKASSTPRKGNLGEMVGPPIDTENTTTLTEITPNTSNSVSDSSGFNVTEEDSIISVHSSFFNSNGVEDGDASIGNKYSDLSLGEVLSIMEEPSLALGRGSGSHINQSQQTSPPPVPQVGDVATKNHVVNILDNGVGQTITLEELSTIVKDICLDKARPSRAGVEIYISHQLKLKLGFQRERARPGRSYYTIAKSPGAMFGGAARAPVTPGKLRLKSLGRQVLRSRPLSPRKNKNSMRRSVSLLNE